MKKVVLFFVSLLYFIFFLFPEKVVAQSFINIGNASNSGGGCYTLTPNLNWQQGTAWYNTPVDLSQPITIQYNLNFGNLDANGADGIAFVLQNQGTAALGAAGIGIGYQGITPSVIVEFDDYQNGFDPANDHVAVTLNGDPDHTSAGNTGAPLVSFPFNIEDGNWHSVQITWDPVTHTLQVSYDCQVWLTYVNDIVNTIFAGNPIVWWGFTSGTGIRTNLHQFCFTPPLILTTNVTNVTCYGQCNGNAAVTNIAGGTAPYTYWWSNGQTTSAATGLCSGTYTIIVTSSQGCVTTDSVIITQPAAALTPGSSVLNNVSCFGGNNGSATSSPSGGTSPYTYAWSNGETTQTATALNAVPGTHTITVTDNNGCTATETVIITHPPPLSSINSQIDVLCNGGNNGSAAVAISGGTPIGIGAYTYQWNNAQTTSSSTGLIAGSYNVLVSDANNCTYTTSFTITQPPALSIITANSTDEFCNRSDGTVTVAAGGGSGSYTYVWTPPVSVTATATGLTAGNYSVTVADANGCSHDTILAVNFIPGPIANAGTDASMCSGSTITLGASGGGNYLWSPSGGLSSTTDANPSVFITAFTTYTVTVIDVNNCTASDDVAVTVYTTPLASFSATSACFTNPTIFTDLSTGNGVQWNWNFGEPSSGINNTSSLQNPTHTYNSTGSFVATLSAYTPEGCKDSTSMTVTVYPLPVTSFVSTTVCIGSPTYFTDMTTVSSGTIIAWSWNFGDPGSGASNIATSQHPSHIFSAVGNFNVLLTVTSTNGCQSTTMLQAVVLFPPVASFTSTNTCLNTATAFTDQSSNAINWYWDFGDGGISSLQNPSHVYLGYGSYVATLIASSTGACADTVTDTVIVYPPPVPKFISDTVCLGDSTSFFNLSYIPAGIINGWYWNFGDGDSSSLQYPAHLYSSSGTFTVTLMATSGNGCSSVIAGSALVDPLPNANFSFSPLPTTELIDVVHFNDLSTGVPVLWWWNFGDGDTSFLQNPSHIYPDTGAFVVTLVVASINGCVDTVQHSIQVRDFTFYIPNSFTPNEDGINDFFFGKGIGIIEYELIIFDRWGKEIFYCKVNDLPQILPCMWDGKVEDGKSNKSVQEDVYIWKVNLTNVFKEVFNYIGHVSIVR